VTKLHSDVHDFYRLFEIPGFDHCFGGLWGQPTSIFELLRNWVENGTAPASSPFNFFSADGRPNYRVLCPYPQMARFIEECGNSAFVECWKCTEEGREGETDPEVTGA
jgi:tannase/feruloyl esterase